MKRLINIVIAVYIVTLILSTKVNADAGYMTNSRIAGGPIYALEEHPDIALEKELLIYQGKGDCKVHFLFKNSSNKLVSAKAGFPVEFIVPLKMGPGDPAREIIGELFGEENFEDRGYDRQYDLLKAKASIQNTTKRLMFDKNKFDHINSYWEDLQYPPQWVENIAIFQDGKEISIDSILVEGKITTGDTVYIQFHFLHELLFKPSSFSHVTVEYSINSVGEEFGPSGDFALFYQWHYVLGTGRTWKGPINVIYLAVPEYLTPNLPPAFTRIGNFKKDTYYMAQKYEPSVNDKIDIGYFGYEYPCSSDDSDGYCVLDGGELGCDTLQIIQLEEPKKTAQSFVVVKNASSYLPQRTWVNSSITMNVPFNTPFWSDFSSFPESSTTVEWAVTTCKNIGFGPLSLFDGIPESAWCEGVPSDGIGEWVEFELKEDVLGLGVHNGFKKVTWFLQATHGNQLEQLNAVYTNNNRVLEIISNNGKIKQEIKLLDTPKKQSFESIYLPKGLYKVYIRDIYKRKKYEDTCLGEIEFYSASAKGIIEKDEFFKVRFGQYKPAQTNFQNETVGLIDASQESPSTSKGSSKNFVIVWSGNWQEGQRSGHTIYAQRFSSDGEKLGHCFKVSDEEGTDEPISPNISASSPAVAIDGSGNFVVTWQDERNRDLDRPSFSNEDTYAQRYASDGTPLGSNFKVNDDPGNDDDYRREFQTYPSISMDRSGNFVIAWSDTRNDFCDKDIYAQRYTSDGTALGCNFRVNKNQGSVEQYAAPSVSMDKEGNFVITWEDTRDSLSLDQDIYAQRYTSDGTAIGGNFRVNDDPEDASGSCPAVSFDGSGNFVITWEKSWFSYKGNGDEAIYAQRYASDGSALGNNFKVSSFFTNERMISPVCPSIAADERGNFIIVWLDGRDDVIDIYAQRYASDGTALGSKFKVNDAKSIAYEDTPSISTYGNDNFIIWWDDARKFGDDARSGGYPTDIYAQRYSSDGTAIGSNFRINEKSR